MTLDLRFGGLALAVTVVGGDDDGLLAALGERFAAWAGASGPAALELEVEIDRRLAAGPRPSPVVHEARGADAVRAHRGDLDGVIELEAGAPARARFRVAPTLAALDGALRAALGVVVPARGGLVLHAAAAADARGGVAFVGASGAGKTTIYGLAARAPGWRQIADEQVLVVPAGASGFAVHAWPLGGADAVPGAWAPLRALGLLAHGPGPRMTPCPVERAAGLVLAQARVRLEPAWLAQRALDTTARLLSAVPAWDLAFAPDPAVLGVVSIT